MIDGNAMRRDTDVSVAYTSATTEQRAEQLKQHLSPVDARLYGIDEAYGRSDARGPLVRGLGAALASATLFLSVGALALPAAAFA